MFKFNFNNKRLKPSVRKPHEILRTVNGMNVACSVNRDIEEVCLLWVQRAVLALQQCLVDARLRSCKQWQQQKR